MKTHPKTYREVSPLIEAMQWDGDTETYFDVSEWLADCGNVRTITTDVLKHDKEIRYLLIRIEGMYSSLCYFPGDWVVRSGDDIYMRSDRQFRATHEEVK